MGRSAVLALLLGLAAAPAGAQADAPWSRLEVGVGGAATLSIGELHPLWRAGPGAALRLSTPFHLGTVGVSATRLPFRSRSAERPHFRATLAAAEWSVTPRVAGRVQALAGVQVGVLDMRFHRDGDPIANADENELALGVQAGLTARVADRVRLRLVAGRQRVATRVPLHLSMLSAEVSYSAATPRWLREVLR